MSVYAARRLFARVASTRRQQTQRKMCVRSISGVLGYENKAKRWVVVVSHVSGAWLYFDKCVTNSGGGSGVPAAVL